MAVADNSYISTGADMVSVANKIREKAGVSDGLVFPDGWIEAIEGIEAGGGDGGSVPKPLTFDYMPEGYPTKSVQTTTLMEEQELAFTSISSLYTTQLTNAFKIVKGQTYTVNWDGTEYECVGAAFGENVCVLGNLSIAGGGADTGEPFVYLYDMEQVFGVFATLDTAASHTISVKKNSENSHTDGRRVFAREHSH